MDEKLLSVFGKKIEVTINTIYSTRWNLHSTLKLQGVGVGIRDNILCMYNNKKLVLVPLYNIAKIDVGESTSLLNKKDIE